MSRIELAKHKREKRAVKLGDRVTENMKRRKVEQMKVRQQLLKEGRQWNEKEVSSHTFCVGVRKRCPDPPFVFISCVDTDDACLGLPSRTWLHFPAQLLPRGENLVHFFGLNLRAHTYFGSEAYRSLVTFHRSEQSSFCTEANPSRLFSLLPEQYSFCTEAYPSLLSFHLSEQCSF